MLLIFLKTAFSETKKKNNNFTIVSPFAKDLKGQQISGWPQRLVKPEVPGPLPRLSDSLDMGWDLRIFVSKKFLDESDIASPETMLSSSHCNITGSIQGKIF